jgi:hypothetical protein
MDENGITKEVVAQLRSCLAEVPFCSIDPDAGEVPSVPSGPHCIVRFRLDDEEWIVLLEAKNSGQPRVARAAANLLLRCANQYANPVLVFAAPYISPEAARILWQENINYVDLSGNCRIRFGRVYISKENQPNKFAIQRDLRSLYSAKAERVMRTLLLEPKREWKIKELAETARVSLGQASNVKKLLDDREWVRRDERGIRLTQPDRLLKEWSENYKYRRNKMFDYYSMDSLPEIEAKVADACNELRVTYALAGLSAAARLAPSVRYQRAMVYIGDRTSEVAARAGLKSVASGPNVTLIAPYDEGVFVGTRQFQDVNVTSAIQTYLDAKGFRGRGEEAAEAVLREVIEPTW